MKKEEKNENGEVKPRSVIRKKKEWNTRAGRTPYSGMYLLRNDSI